MIAEYERELLEYQEAERLRNQQSNEIGKAFVGRGEFPGYKELLEQDSKIAEIGLNLQKEADKKAGNIHRGTCVVLSLKGIPSGNFWKALLAMCKSYASLNDPSKLNPFEIRDNSSARIFSSALDQDVVITGYWNQGPMRPGSSFPDHYRSFIQPVELPHLLEVRPRYGVVWEKPPGENLYVRSSARANLPQINFYSRIMEQLEVV